MRDVLSTQEIWPEFRVKPAKADMRYTLNRQLFDARGNFFAPAYSIGRHDWESNARPGDRAVVVVRDPRDRLVSLLFSHIYSHTSDPRTDLYREVLASQRSLQDILKLMIFTEGSHALYSFYAGWQPPLPANCILIRYEDLVADEIGTFLEIAKWTGLKYEKSALFAAIERNSFEARSGRARGIEDKFSHYRIAMPGSWRNHFDRSLGQVWESLDPGMFRSIGYEDRDDWWQLLPETCGSSMPRVARTEDTHSSSLLKDRNIALAATVKRLEMENEEKERIIADLANTCAERLNTINELVRTAEERLALANKLKLIADERLELLTSNRTGTASHATEGHQGRRTTLIQEESRSIEEGNTDR